MKRILAIDDDSAICSALRIILKTEGYDATVVSTSKDFFAALKKSSFDVFLLDVMLKEDVTGFDLFNVLIGENPLRKVIFLTAVKSTSQDLRLLKSQGMFDYLEKPFDNAELISVIKRAHTQLNLQDKVVVGYGHIGVEHAPKKIQTVLGSCVALTVYDKKLKIGGITHIMFSFDNTKFETVGPRNAIEQLLRRMYSLGSSLESLEFELYGGAKLMSHTNLDVGEKNIKKVLEIIKEKGICLKKKDVLGTKARQVVLDTKTGQVLVVYLT